MYLQNFIFSFERAFITSFMTGLPMCGVQCDQMVVDTYLLHSLHTTGHTVVYMRFGDLVAKINGNETVVANIMCMAVLR